MKVPITISFDIEVIQEITVKVNSNRKDYKSISNFVNELCKKDLQEKKQPITKKKGEK